MIVKAATILLLACTRTVLSFPTDFISPWTAGWSVVISGQGTGYVGDFMAISSEDYGDSVQEISPPSEEEAANFVTQYMAQDELGQVTFGYSHPGQAATNYRDAWGKQVGNYAFTSPEGDKVMVAYIADDQGYRAFSDHLPVAPKLTDEVATATAEHLAVYQAIKNRPDIHLLSNLLWPQPVTDNPEVVNAKAEFMKVFNEVKSRKSTTV